MLTKQYSKLTSEQFAEFFQFLSGVFAMLRDEDARLVRTPAAKFDGAMSGDYGDYSEVYGLPFIQQLARVVFALIALTR